MDYIIHIIIVINIYVILTTSTNLLLGLANLLSLGQAAFYGLGAYISVFCLMGLGLPLIPTILIVMLSLAIISLIVAVPSLRLKGDYFVLATLGFQLIVFTILYNWVSVTKGPFGIAGIPSPKIFGILPISGIYAYLIFSFVLSVIVTYIFNSLIHSPFGRVLKGIRDDELAVMSLGRNVTLIKIWVFAISSSFIGLAGLLYATYISYIDPTSFNLDEAIFIVSALIIGGTGNIKGPAIGAVFVVVLPELLRFVGLPDSVASNLRQIVYGMSLIVLMYFRPQGLLGKYKLG